MLKERTLPAGFIAPCLPTKAQSPPSEPLWFHEIKHDGFRVVARKDGAHVRLYSRPGNDLTYRFPLIAESLARLRSYPDRCNCICRILRTDAPILPIRIASHRRQ